MIKAPRDGTLIRLNVFERGQALKEGDELFTIVPDTSQRAVELWISGNDIPIVQQGDHVRLHFEGWPAVQSDGAFGGEVMTIDPTADTAGNFRILIKPDGKVPWPDKRYLRPGVRQTAGSLPVPARIRSLAAIEWLWLQTGMALQDFLTGNSGSQVVEDDETATLVPRTHAWPWHTLGAADPWKLFLNNRSEGNAGNCPPATALLSSRTIELGNPKKIAAPCKNSGWRVI